MPLKKISYKDYITPSDYMKFDEGDTQVAIVSNGGMCRMHGMRTAKGYVNMGMCSEDSKCEQCKDNREAKLRWMWIVYLPKYKVVRLMETGKKLGDQICKLAQKLEEAEDDIQNYLINVHKEGTMLQTVYTSRLDGKVTLTEDDKLIIEPAKKFLVKKHFESK
jgi:hypothetical protein